MELPNHTSPSNSVLWTRSFTKHLLSVYHVGPTLVPEDVKLKTWLAVLTNSQPRI